MLLISIFVGVFIWPGLTSMSLAQDFTLAGTGEAFPLNGVIDIEMIGEGYPGVGVVVYGALVCHTDDITCCRGLDNPDGGGRGEWYLPGQTIPIPAPTDTTADWYRSRAASVLRLNSRNFSTTPTGVYRCEIPTTSGIVDKFIGVYDAGTVALCPNLNLANGVVTYNRADIPGKVATHTCSTGYTLSGSSTRTCTSGGWDVSEPNCVQVAVCSSLTLPTNVMTITYNPPGSPTSQGTVATYQCITGYTPNPSTRTCQSDGTWSGGETTCAAIPTRLVIAGVDQPSIILITAVGPGGEPPNAALACFTPDPSVAVWYFPDGSIIPIEPPTVPDNIVSVRQLSSNAITLHRRNDVTSPTGLYCCGSPALPVDQRLCINLVLPCSSLTTPDNGAITYNPPGATTGLDTVATYGCINGYTLMGSATRTCQSDGSWTGDDPTCQSVVDCGSPPSIANGSPGVPDRTTTGGMVTYTCEDGYQISPGVTMMTSSCQASGIWDTVTCTVVDCGPPPSIANGSPGTTVMTTFGGTVTYTCDSGYEVSSGVAMTTVMCLSNGMWEMVTCTVLPCSSLTTPDNGDITYNPPGATTGLDTVATYGCSDGYTLMGSDTRTCQSDGSWTGDDPTCQSAVDCGQPPSITNGSPGVPDRTTFGGTVTYTCDSGYQISTMMTSSCLADGTWETPPTCTAVNCGQPPDITNGSPGTPDRTTFGGTVTYTCEDGLTLSGQAMITCMANGMWSTPPSCLADCDPLSAPDNGQIMTTGTTFTSMATYSCNEGYNLIGSRTLTCGSDRMWTPAVPSCIPVQCGTPPSIANGNPGSPTSTTFEGTVAYSCNTGYIIIGSTTITCLSTGSWSSPPVCQPLPPVYLTLSDANHISGISEIPLSSVGEGANSLSCRTDDANCCRVEDAGVVKGTWHYPNGSVVSSDSGDLYTTREGPMVVNLNRRDGVDGPTGLYCCEIPTSAGTDVFCANLSGPALGSPSTQCDNTGAIVGGVVAIVLIIAFSITAVLIAYIVLRQRRTGGVDLKRSQPNIPLTDKGQSVMQQTYETVDTTYEEIDGTRPLKGNYDYTHNQAYAATTAPLRGEGVVNTGGSGNPTGDSQVGRDEEKIYEN